MANEYLQRTPTSTGNNKVFTWSGWVKRSIFAANYVGSQNLFRASGGSGGDCGWRFDYSTPTDSLRVFLNGSSSGQVQSVGKSRDPGNWMHVILAFNSTLEQDSARVRIYVNGALVPDDSNSVYPTKNYATSYNELVTQYISAYNGSTEFFSGEMFDIFFIDGQALTPDVFGFYKDGDGYISVGSTTATDFRPGQWIPHSPSIIKKSIERRGGFGVNGFYLPMNDSSNPGADFHCAPNSIITLKGEDLPQPRNGAPTTSDAYVSQLRSDPYAANLVLAVPGISTSTSANLVTNGTFDNNVSGWSASGGTLTWNNGRAQHVTTGTNFPVYQQITGLTIGQRYTFQYTHYSGYTSAYINTTTISSGNILALGDTVSSSEITKRGSFTATATSHYVIIYGIGNNTSIWDDVVVKQEDAPRDYSADIKGSGSNKTLTPNGGAGVGYELGNYYGSAMTFDGSGDYFTVPASSDLDFGTGDFTAEFWLLSDSTNSSAYRRWLTTTSAAFSSGTWVIREDAGGVDKAIGGLSVSTGANAFQRGQWNHIAWTRYGTTETIYVNGVSVGINTNSTANYNEGATNGLYVGGFYSVSSDEYFDGNIQDLRVYKGVAKYKGGFDVPKPYTPVGIESWRTTADTCKNNFATLNPLNQTNITFANGNLTTSEPGPDGGRTYGTMGSNTGKWYYEAYVEDVGLPNTGGTLIGINPLTQPSSNLQNRTAYRSDGNIYNDSGTSSGNSGLAYVAGDTIGVAWDADNKRLWFAKNNTWVLSGDPAGNSNPSVNYTNTETQGPFVVYDNGTGAKVTHLNFGQNPSFSGQLTAGTYTDSNGKGLFKYEPPSGFLALCEDNLPTPAIKNPGEYFKTVLYHGDSNDSRSITGVGFKPDLVWIKERTSNSGHYILDSLRGATNYIRPNEPDAEASNANTIKSFDFDGFTLGNSGAFNSSTDDYVAWCWKAGGAAVTNTDGTITSQVSANQDAGFSIVSYTGNQTAGVTIGHGLGKVPSMVIVKSRTGARDWIVYHKSTGSTGFILLNGTGLFSTASTFWNDTTPSDSTFTLGTALAVNASTENFIAYCWAEIEGFSKFGSYVGNQSADGPFVYCGFKPAFVMIKWADGSADWVIQDSSRTSTNPSTKALLPSSANPELDASTLSVDFLSNGFKIRNTNGAYNNASTYIFAAFAESPFQTANAK